VPHVHVRNVNDAFTKLVANFVMSAIQTKEGFPTQRTTSRAGDVAQLLEPIIVSYAQPRERVLFNEARDANPFLHLMESLWMLAGRRDIDPIAYYSAKYPTYVKDGDREVANGAYGYRWRHERAVGIKSPSPDIAWNQPDGGGWDQLQALVQHLKKNPNSRRGVLQMWDPTKDLLQAGGVPYYEHGTERELYSKDVCCNLCCVFSITNNALDMTVYNRSNDLVLGMLGANAVHFSFLLEYMAAQLSCEVGVYHQVSSNLHVYTESFNHQEWLADTTPDHYLRMPRLNSVGLVEFQDQFDKELLEFNYGWLGMDLDLMEKMHLPGSDVFKEPFLAHVAYPMALAYYQHKQRQYKIALEWASQIWADDWRIACTTWLRRRQAGYNRRKAIDDGVHAANEDKTPDNPYLENELKRLESGSEHA